MISERFAELLIKFSKQVLASEFENYGLDEDEYSELEKLIEEHDKQANNTGVTTR